VGCVQFSPNTILPLEATLKNLTKYPDHPTPTMEKVNKPPPFKKK
jgi:hypothetical protein